MATFRWRFWPRGDHAPRSMHETRGRQRAAVGLFDSGGVVFVCLLDLEVDKLVALTKIRSAVKVQQGDACDVCCNRKKLFVQQAGGWIFGFDGFGEKGIDLKLISPIGLINFH